eukprot:4367628-Amphidinium_carterae.1
MKADSAAVFFEVQTLTSSTNTTLPFCTIRGRHKYQGHTATTECEDCHCKDVGLLTPHGALGLGQVDAQHMAKAAVMVLTVLHGVDTMQVCLTPRRVKPKCLRDPWNKWKGMKCL